MIFPDSSKNLSQNLDEVDIKPVFTENDTTYASVKKIPLKDLGTNKEKHKQFTFCISI